jgi:hypothetical protein
VRFPAGPEDKALDRRTRAQVAADAVARAAELGLAPGARVLVTRPWTGPQDWIDTLLAPLAVTGSVVYVRSTARSGDPASLDRRAEQERVTNRI